MEMYEIFLHGGTQTYAKHMWVMLCSIRRSHKNNLSPTHPRVLFQITLFKSTNPRSFQRVVMSTAFAVRIKIVMIAGHGETNPPDYTLRDD